ncbi:MAG: PRC-barrel domain-containing protein [Chloroflexi bacterium]|nr:PRC-barrel domain-containing protein [Chloroflexota bacterium]MBU1750688.1 PRC-barrel domain-containing protein [Chloroflexota bacterium]
MSQRRMLRKAQEMFGFTVHVLDGTAGKVDDFLFDDERWIVRYLVVDTGPELGNRRVLISPVALEPPLWEAHELPVRLTREQIANSPDIDLEQPVSRQHEIALHKHYEWPYYWFSAPLGPLPIIPTIPLGIEKVEAEKEERQESTEEETSGDPHLRSVRAVTDYRIHATDGTIGHLDDVFIDEDDWSIRYLLVATHDWLPGRKVLVAPDWIERVSWPDEEIRVCHSRQQIKDSPEYDPVGAPSRAYETDLYQYYGFPGYWGGHWEHDPTLKR